MTVDDLIHELQRREPNDNVPIHLAVAATGWDASHLSAALEQLDAIGEVFGRPIPP